MAGPENKSTSIVECIIFGIVLIAIWVSSLTFLLPLLLLLKFNKAIQHKLFTCFFLGFLGRFCRQAFVPLRKVTFEILKDKLIERKVKKPFKVLEIGIGSGANFKYYPEGSSLIAVDMNPNFESSLRETLEEYPEVEVERLVYAMAEDMSDVDDDSVDVVVSTLVLCSTMDASKVLKETRRVLRPGGLFLFVEHVAFPNNLCGKIVQKIASPLCEVFFAGCRVDRDTVNRIKKNGFSEIDLRMTEVPELPLFLRPMAYGIAIK